MLNQNGIYVVSSTVSTLLVVKFTEVILWRAVHQQPIWETVVNLPLNMI